MCLLAQKHCSWESLEHSVNIVLMDACQRLCSVRSSDLRVTCWTSALQTTDDLPLLGEGRPRTTSVVTSSPNRLFRHFSVYPFPESSKKVANFHTHQVNSNWAVPQTIESSAKICGSLELPRSYILPRNSSRFLHTWHGTLSGIMTSRKAATAESSCLHAVGCVGCLLGASAEVLSLSISDECQNTCFQISLSSRVLFLYIVFILVFASTEALANLSTAWQMCYMSSQKRTRPSASASSSWVSHQPPVEFPACAVGRLILKLPWLIGAFAILLRMTWVVIVELFWTGIGCKN